MGEASHHSNIPKRAEFALGYIRICEGWSPPNEGLTGLMFLCYVPLPTALPRRSDALQVPVGPSGRKLAAKPIDQAEH